MEKSSRRLSFIEASALVMGSGVGGGIMAVPFLASRNGFLPFVIILLAAYGFNILIHLMLVEVMFRDGKNRQIVELVRTYLFSGKAGLWLVWFFFIILFFSFLANLSAYIEGGGAIIRSFTGLPSPITRLIMYGAAGSVVFFGLKIVGIFEKFAFYGIALLIVLILTIAVKSPFSLALITVPDNPGLLALYGMIMYSLYSFFAVPQAVKGLSPDKPAAVKAVVVGLSLNCFLIFTITLITMGISGEVTEVAVIGIRKAAGSAAGTAGSVFILLAMLTSFWSISLALSDIIRERTGLSGKLTWLIATLPPLAFAFTGSLGYIDFLRLAGGAVSIILILITIPMYLRAKKDPAPGEPEWSLGRWTHPFVLTVLAGMTILMAVGSLIAI